MDLFWGKKTTTNCLSVCLSSPLNNKLFPGRNYGSTPLSIFLLSATCYSQSTTIQKYYMENSDINNNSTENGVCETNFHAVEQNYTQNGMRENSSYVSIFMLEFSHTPF